MLLPTLLNSHDYLMCSVGETRQCWLELGYVLQVFKESRKVREYMGPMMRTD